MGEEEMERLELPDEAEYPQELTGAYELLERFSSKHETVTLLARSRSDHAMVTVKCFPRSHPYYALSEPEVLRSLDAPPLPHFVAEYKNAVMRCVIREYISGEPLDSYAEQHPLGTAEILEIGTALCSQLHALHSAVPPVIHRDVKPQNIIIREDGSPVLIDFGISRVYSEKISDTVAFGTQGFAPPEQYGFAQTDARSDIYSLGMVLNWLAHGDMEKEQKVQSPLDRVIGKMTAFDPQQRYATALQARTALQKARPESRRKRLILSVSLAVLFLAGIFLAVFLAFHPGRTQVRFSHPLVEKAVRLNLGMNENAPVYEDMLQDVRGIYIVADGAFGNAESFYDAVGQWYASGRSVRGDMENLADLEKMTGLEQVCVAAQKIADISALSSLAHLNKVEFKHNSIQDISCLAGMGDLSYVGINGNPVKDITPLLGCPRLAFLDLCDVRSYDPSVIGQLGNFDYLDISNPTNSYQYLGEKSVLSLSLAWTGLTTLEDLSRITRLEDLDISHTSVSDLTPLTVHQGLQHVKMAGTPVKDLGPLLVLPELQSVTLSEDMKPLAEALGETAFGINYE